MSLPGLSTEEPIKADVKATATVDLEAESEWRFEVAHGSRIEIKILSGTAELFGTELAVNQPYQFTGTKAAIFTWHGCRIEIQGSCQSEYVAEETPQVSYINLHFALDRLRDEAVSKGGTGPRVLLIGPEDAGKTSLSKFLTAYAIRAGRRPIMVNVDPEEGFLSMPGTLSAAAFTSVLDVEDGWGTSPTNGPISVPVKVPLTYHLGRVGPERHPDLYKPVISRLALTVTNRIQDEKETYQAGCIIDTPGSLTRNQTTYDLLHHIILEFSVNIIVTIGSERLHSDFVKRYPSSNTKTNGQDQTHPFQSITVLKVDKSGGCVDRDATFRQAQIQAGIREYFFGDGVKTTLSPQTQLLDFSHFEYHGLFRLLENDSEGAENSDSFLPGDYYDPSDDLPEGEAKAGVANLNINVSQKTSKIYEKISTPSPQMQNGILTLVNATASDSQSDIRDATVLGFLCVVEVDERRKKVKVLAPSGARIPNKALIWGRWPELTTELL